MPLAKKVREDWEWGDSCPPLDRGCTVRRRGDKKEKGEMSRNPGLSRAARLSALPHGPGSLGTTVLSPQMPGVSPGEEQDWALGWRSCCCSVTQPCPTLCDLMNCSTPGLPVLHYFLEFAQTHVHWVSDHPTISSSVVRFSSCLQSFPASGSFPMSWLFISGGQSIKASVSA